MNIRLPQEYAAIKTKPGKINENTSSGISKLLSERHTIMPGKRRNISRKRLHHIAIHREV